jgi:hypothetical protein
LAGSDFTAADTDAETQSIGVSARTDTLAMSRISGVVEPGGLATSRSSWTKKSKVCAILNGAPPDGLLIVSATVDN